MITDYSASQNKKSPPERTGRRVHPFPIYRDHPCANNAFALLYFAQMDL